MLHEERIVSGNSRVAALPIVHLHIHGAVQMYQHALAAELPALLHRICSTPGLSASAAPALSIRHAVAAEAGTPPFTLAASAGRQQSCNGTRMPLDNDALSMYTFTANC